MFKKLLFAIGITAAVCLAADANLLKTTIETYEGGGLTAVKNGNTVTVTGEITDAKKTLSLNIDSDVTLIWQAHLSGNASYVEGDPDCDHDWGTGWNIIVHPTCMAKGSQKRECAVANCGRVEIIDIAINSDAHSWIDNWAVITQATETTAGLKRRLCGNGCGEKQEENIPATACVHKWGSYEVTTAATCNAKGIETRTCSECGGENTKEIPVNADAHKWIDNWQTTTQPTCSAKGTRVRACANSCGETQELTDVAIVSGNHNYQNWTETTPATCTADGIETGVCTHNSEHTTTRKGQDALGHDYQWTVTTSPTCIAAGEEAGVCSHNSGHTTTRDIPINPNAHQGGSEWTLDVNIGLERIACTLCGKGTGDTRPLSTIANVTAYLTAPANIGTLTEPLPLVVGFNLGVDSDNNNNWQQMLRAVAAAGDYVELDLSACSMSNSIFSHAYATVGGKDRIVSIVLPDVARSISNGTAQAVSFSGFTNLKTVIAEKLTDIGNFSFYSRTSLTSVDFPAVTRIGQYAFYSCSKLTGVNFPAVTNIEQLAFNYSGLTSVDLPNVINIAGYTFQNCTNLSGISIPSVTNISSYAFEYCPLTSVTIAANIPTFDTRQGDGQFELFRLAYTDPGIGNKRAGNYKWDGAKWIFNGPPVPPAKPQNLYAAISSPSSIKLTWVAGGTTATSYRIERRTSALGDYEQIASGVTASPYNDTELTYGNEYFYRVYAVNTIEESEPAETNRLIVGPSTPTNVKVATSDLYIYLIWESDNATSSILTITPNNGSPVTKTGGGWAYSSIKIANETSQTIQFYTLNGAGSSPESVTITGKFENPPPVPAAPTNLTATPTTQGIQLSWTGSSGATSYEIHRSTNSTSGFEYKYLQNGSPYTDRYVTGGTTYYYRIYARNSSGNSVGYASANATAMTVANTVLEGTWNGTGAVSASTYTFNVNGTTNLNGVTMYKWRYNSGSNAIILSYGSIDSDPVPFSISGNTMTLGGNSSILLAGTYTKWIPAPAPSMPMSNTESLSCLLELTGSGKFEMRGGKIENTVDGYAIYNNGVTATISCAAAVIGKLSGVSQDEHNFPSAWTITKAATKTEDGSKEKVCTKEGCTHKITEVIPKTGTTSIKETQENKRGLFKQNIVSDKMEIMLNGKVSFVVYDMTGNIVANQNGKTWNLRNSAGRFVANGTYLVIVEVKSVNGMNYHYSAKLGVKR